jgi:heparin binding hemagglutinin HbhA
MAKAKFDIKTVQTEAQKSAQRAFHAGVGVTDLAVEVVRDYTAGAQKRIASLQKSVSTIEPKALRTQAAKDAKARRAAIEKLVAQLQAQLQSEAVAVPAKVQKAIDINVEAATDTYGDLVKRGESLVGRIRRQQSTQDTVAAAETTVTKAKTTRTQATKAAKKTTTAAKKTTTAAKKRTATPRSSAKATATSAKKTVSAGSRALTDAAAKVGD